MRKTDIPDVKKTEKRISILVCSYPKFHFPQKADFGNTKREEAHRIAANMIKCYARAVISAFHKKTFLGNVVLER